tara:strand:+ start:755 stop:961 length:207 start_codon:yes stop_codon:yes gene_type:complete
LSFLFVFELANNNTIKEYKPRELRYKRKLIAYIAIIICVKYFLIILSVCQNINKSLFKGEIYHEKIVN